MHSKRTSSLPGQSFQARWLGRFGLPEADWKDALRERLAERPFSDLDEAFSLICFLFEKVPAIVTRHQDSDTLLLAEAFGWTCFAFWQCGSAFPSFPENYAHFLREALDQSPRKRSTIAKLVAGIIVTEKADEGRCGFNRLALDKPGLIRESETLIHDGRYEEYLKAAEKYAEYEDALCRSPEFKADWQRIKEAFPTHANMAGMIRRTLVPERNWERGPGAEFGDDSQRFQAVFDLFCWKYYLWAMEGDHPCLLKASVVFTPFGTQIFIPGYLSFDSKRDLDFGKIAELHRARGVSRQGKAFSESRMSTAEMQELAKKADQEARAQGMKGDKRYAFICRSLELRDHGDYRKVKRLLE